ncbi:hypothetical protein LCGC14_0900330 [marine sediment metagenome]|uniref:Uncharacterized protein n=1 Tax=marine sediment metagenome TaxID=412755 RepID=A0A0F9RFQ3_9ZZZZ
MQLTERQNEFYSAMEQTFASAGWTLLIQGWQQEYDSLAENAFYNAKNFEDLEETRVRYRLLHELITLPETIASQKQVILDSDEDERNPYE